MEPTIIVDDTSIFVGLSKRLINGCFKINRGVYLHNESIIDKTFTSLRVIFLGDKAQSREVIPSRMESILVFEGVTDEPKEGYMIEGERVEFVEETYCDAPYNGTLPLIKQFIEQRDEPSLCSINEYGDIKVVSIAATGCPFATMPELLDRGYIVRFIKHHLRDSASEEFMDDTHNVRAVEMLLTRYRGIDEDTVESVLLECLKEGNVSPNGRLLDILSDEFMENEGEENA